MWAVPCEAPTIVQCPYDLDSVFFYPVKQHGKINIAVVKIMKVQDVRFNLIQFFQQSPGWYPCKTTIQTSQIGNACTEKFFGNTADDNVVFLWGQKISAFGIGAKGSKPLCFCKRRNTVYDTSGTPNVCAVNEYDGFQYSRLQNSKLRCLRQKYCREK